MSRERIDEVPARLPSGRHGLPREYVVNSQRARLLRAAVQIGGATGYASMTVSAIIREARVSRKTFYELFEDREDIFLAAYDRLTAQAIHAMRDAYAVDGAWPERLCRMLRDGLDALASHPREARFCFVEVLAAGPRALARRSATMRTFTEFLAPGYEIAGAARPRIPALMPDAIVGALNEVLYEHVVSERTAELPDLLPDLLYCALAPFLGPLEASERAAAAIDAIGGRAALAMSSRTRA